MSNLKANRRFRIKKRIRKNISGTPSRPRLSVFRSNKQIYAQLIDDVNGVTLASASSFEKDKDQKGNKIDQAKTIGKVIAENAIKAGIKEIKLFVKRVEENKRKTINFIDNCYNNEASILQTPPPV